MSCFSDNERVTFPLFAKSNGERISYLHTTAQLPGRNNLLALKQETGRSLLLLHLLKTKKKVHLQSGKKSEKREDSGRSVIKHVQ